MKINQCYINLDNVTAAEVVKFAGRPGFCQLQSI